jgi:hypothetical protein
MLPPVFRIDIGELGMVVYDTYNPRYSGGKSRRITV